MNALAPGSLGRCYARNHLHFGLANTMMHRTIRHMEVATVNEEYTTDVELAEIRRKSDDGSNALRLASALSPCRMRSNRTCDQSSFLIRSLRNAVTERPGNHRCLKMVEECVLAGAIRDLSVPYR